MDVVSLCRSVTREAIEKQIEIMRMDAQGDPQILSVQQRVMDSLLDRGWGHAPQTVNLAGDVAFRVNWGADMKPDEQ